MKKLEEPILEVIRFGTVDIIATSGTQTADEDKGNENEIGFNS